MAILTKLFIGFLVVVAAPLAHAVQHTVGGNSGWTTGPNYDTWAAAQTFTVGDTLLFNYGFNHGVDVVRQSDYQSCTTGNAITSYTGSPTTVNLDNAGTMYFVCPTSGHCGQGMKLTVTVAAASSGSPPTTPSGGSSPPTTPSGGSPPTTPSGGSPSPPSGTRSPPSTPEAPSGSGATGGFGNMNQFVIGFSMVVVAVVAFMV